MNPLVRFGVLSYICVLLSACKQREEAADDTRDSSAPSRVARDVMPAALLKESVAKAPAIMDAAPGEGKQAQPAAPTTAEEPSQEPPVMQAVPVPADPALVFEAVRSNDPERLQELLLAGLPAEQINEEGDTPLCLALRLRHLPLALKLLEHGAKAGTPGFDKQPPVVLASMYRHPTLLEDLLNAGANANQPFKHPVSPQILEIVPDPWLKKELKRERNVTPLMACSIRGDVEGVITLIRHGAKTSAHTLPSYRYAINMAADHKYLFIMRVLLGRDPDEEPPRLITVDLSEQRVWVVQHGQEIMRSKISSGRNGKETPDGRYVITNKHKDWKSTIYKVPMPYFLRLNCGEIGLHSGRVTGRPASAGCIRLPHEVAKKMFALAQVGDEVIVQQ